MSKETLVQRREREAREEALEVKKATASWPARMMSNLERAILLGGTISVQNGTFQILLKDIRGDMEVLPLSAVCCNRDTLADMENLESTLEYAEGKRAEERRLNQVRVDALAKLNKEERAVLGL